MISCIDGGAGQRMWSRPKNGVANWSGGNCESTDEKSGKLFWGLELGPLGF